MANLTISQLSRAYALSGSELIPVSQADHKQGNALTTFFTTVSALVSYVRDAAIPPGVIWSYAGNIGTSPKSLPKGWLLCDGTAVSIKTYKKLYETILNTYGTSALPGVLFKLPDLKGRFIIGYNSLEPAQTPTFGNFNDSPFTFGKYGGEFNHALTEAELPSHSHPVHVTPGDTKFLVYPFQSGDSKRVEQDQAVPPNGPGSTLVRVNFKPTMLPIGGSRPHNTTPPYQAINYIIKY